MRASYAVIVRASFCVCLSDRAVVHVWVATRFLYFPFFSGHCCAGGRD